MAVDYNKVAILGGGNIALATSVEFSSSGFKVNVFELPEFRNSIQPVIKRGGIEFSGISGNGFTKLNIITDDIEEALEDAGLIILSVPAYGHKIFFETCLPHLQDGQIFLIATGYFGCLRFAKKIHGLGKHVLMAEMNITPYTCTKISPTHLYINGKREGKETYIAALPAKDTIKVLNILKSIYPGITPAQNVLQTSLDNINWIIHPPVTLLHRGMVERTENFTLPLRDSIPPSVVKLMEDMEKERLMLGQAFGLNLPPIQHCLEIGGESVELEKAIRQTKEFETYDYKYYKGTHKYMNEDLYHGLPPLSSLARLIEVPTPTIDAVIHIFSIIDDIDYMNEGVNAEKMGIEGMNTKEVLKLVNDGF
jgi:opine dehydrogenase